MQGALQAMKLEPQKIFANKNQILINFKLLLFLRIIYLKLFNVVVT